MILFPAIDLKDGQCVRLLRGEMNTAEVVGEDPAAQARSFQDAGCEWLHLVDLNGAVEGRPVNGETVDAILAAIDIPVQLGGGIRDMATIEDWLDRGVARVILGTAAAEAPDLVRQAARQHEGRIAVAIDARSGRVAVRGWSASSTLTVSELAQRFEDAGVAVLIHTDIERDGAMEGPNVAATAALARLVSVPVIASGGISRLEDLVALRDCGTRLEGAISGRAIYDGALDLKEALAALAEGPARPERDLPAPA